MAVKGTTNYVYFMDRSLGTGATGTVYFGRHKRRGDPCAIKVFRPADGGTKELQLRQREFQVMSMLKHENIVRFIDIEQESHGPDQVLIMELCTGGSIYKMLEDSTNAFGFPEDEFIIFLSDISKALQYLRKEGIIHRDIKPGNILRYIKDDLSSVYKLTDFGAARMLTENEEFMSLYGTEEYLHPDLYARALLHSNHLNQYPHTFNASVDLWSLGVTLYHVATGQLPFQPFGGRKNKEAMHTIISKKDPGFISGVQKKKDGDIEWSRDLPKTCALSLSLKKLLVPVLVGLLESERRHQWTFENFFQASKNITSRTIVHFFSLSNCSQGRLYIGKEERKSLSHFQDALAEITKIPSGQQLLFHERWSLESIVLSGNEESSPIQVTSVECPMFVVPLTYLSTDWMMENCELPISPVVPPAIDISEDAMYARSASAYVMFLHEKTILRFREQSLLAVGASHLGKFLAEKSHDLQLISQCLSPIYEKLSKIQTSEMLLLSPFNRQLTVVKADFKKVEESLRKISQDVSSQPSSLTEFLKAFCSKICLPSSNCVRKQAHLVKELDTIKNTFKEHKRKEKELSYNEQQIHKFDRGRAADGVRKSLELYKKHCLVNTEAAWKQFQSYHNLYSQRKTEMDTAHNLLQEILEKLTAFNENLIDFMTKKTIEKTNKTEYLNSQNLSTHSEDDSAFVNDSGRMISIKATDFSNIDEKRTTLHEIESEFNLKDKLQPHFRHVYRPNGSITEETDELLVETLKHQLKETSELLKRMSTTSDDNNEHLQRLFSSVIILSKS